MAEPRPTIEVCGAAEHNLKNVDVSLDRGAITVITGVSGSGKSSLAFDTVLAEAQRRFFYTLSHYSRQFLDLTSRPAVRSLSGLSPAISLAQNETPPSRRATVGTLTDVSELIGVMFARFGEQRCPTHDLPTAALSPDEIVSHLLESQAGKTLALTATIAEAKKGTFKSQLTGFAEKGFLKAMIDGELVALQPTPALAREEKHTIKLIVDYVKVKPEARARLLRSVETALAAGGGYGTAYAADGSGALDLKSGVTFAAAGGCPTCGYAWPRLDARYFSANSLGKCEECEGYGTTDKAAADAADDAEDDALAVRERTGQVPTCVACGGTGLSSTTNAIRLAGYTPRQLHSLLLEDLDSLLHGLLGGAESSGKADALAAAATPQPFGKPTGSTTALAANAAFRRVATEVHASVRRIVDIGLGYLTVARRIRSLSGGESQRLKLAGILSENLRGVLYVLDEPSQGLHPTEIDRLLGALRRLRDGGNTVVVVDHDEALMRGADWIVDLGPGGGARGGRIMAKFRPAEAASFAKVSTTAAHLGGIAAGHRGVPAPVRAADPTNAIVIDGATLHNLRIDRAVFPKEALTVVAGVSGAGKSSLVLATLYPNAAQAVAGKTKRKPLHARAVTGLDDLLGVSLVDRRPIAKSSVSMPASYLDIFGVIRDLYASLPDAQVMGLTARSFSLSVDAGRCPECKGKGELSLSMRFLADARVVCPLCQGRRYQANVLAVRYNGLSIGEVLNLTLDEANEVFKNHKKIAARLAPAVALGLGYLKLGQPSSSLSGGEAQRLKLVPHLTRGARVGKGQLIVLDEPTTGLHFEDVRRLLTVLRSLVEGGATVVTIEHNEDVLAAADWVLELGPGAAAAGGRLVAMGPRNPAS